MEKIFYVKDGNLTEVNKVLSEGGKVKFIEAAGQDYGGEAFVVIEMPDKYNRNQHS